MKKVISLFMAFVMLFGLISNYNLAVYASDREVTNLHFNIVKPYEIYEGTHTNDIVEGTNGWHYFFDEFNDGDSIVIDYTDNSTEKYICKDGIFRKSDNEDKLMYIATYGFTYKGTGKTYFEYMIEDDVKSLWSGVLPITITENPLETAVFTPIKSYEVVKNTRGYSDDNGEWEYFSPYFNVGDKITVYMKDGSRKVYLYDLEKLPYESETECFYNQSDDNDYISVSTSDFKLNGTGRTSFDVKINEYNKVLQVPVTVVENSNIYSGTYGTNVKWEYNASTKKLNIYGYGDMPGSTNVSNIPWWNFHNDITSVEISSGVTSIGDSAFISCSNLKSVIIQITV